MRPTPSRGRALVSAAALFLVCATLTTAFSTTVVAQTAPEPTGEVITTPDPVPNEYIVTLRTTGADAVRADTADMAEQVADRHGAEVLDVYDQALDGFSARMSQDAAKSLAADPAVASVEENGRVHTDTVTSPQTPTPSWGLDRIDQSELPLDNSYSFVDTAPTVHLYVLDTGIKLDHTDFGGRATFGVDEVGGPECLTSQSDAGHATHVAGTAGGDTYGVAKSVQLVSVRVLDCNGSGSFADVIAGVDWVTANAVKPAVANMSLGGTGSKAVDDAVNASIAAGIVYTVSAGNSGNGNCAQSPARVPAVITVAATTSTDARASFSNFGPCVDLFAPGASITSDWFTSTTATAVVSGTSMSSPHVAGAAALYLQANPAASPAAVASALVGNASPVVTGAGASTTNLLLDTMPGARPLLSQALSAAGPVTPIGVLGAPVSAAESSTGPVVLARAADSSLRRFRPKPAPPTWDSLGGATSADPVVTSSGDGVVAAVRGGDNAMYFGRFDAVGAWSGWQYGGGSLGSRPALAKMGSGTAMFMRGSDGGIYTGTLSAVGVWSGWTALGGLTTSDPAAVGDSAGVTVFVRGGDGGAYAGRIESGGTWSGWRALGGYVSADLSASLTPTGTIALFVRGGDNALYQGRVLANDSWSGWTRIGGLVTSDITSVTASNGVYVFLRGGDGGLYFGRLNSDSSWSGFVSGGGYLASDLAATTAETSIEVYVRGGDGKTYRGTVDAAGAWNGWSVALG